MSRATAPAESDDDAVRAVSSRRRGARIALIVVAIGAALLVHTVLPAPMYAVVAAAINVALAVLFGRTLRAGRDPLISRFARAERGTLEPDLARYTRTLTKVWVAFFIAAAACSLWASALSQSAAAWIAFGAPVAIVVLFVGEWAYRRIRFRHYRHASPLALARIVAMHWRRTDER